jgi:hypothetical protein
MAVLNSGAVSLLDIAKGWDPDGSPAAVAELLSQSNPVLDDMLWVEGNLPTGHRTTVRTGLAGATWRMFNQGVPVSKGTKAQIDEASGMLESWGEVDVDLANLGGNAAAFRTSEGFAHVEALNQEFTGTLFYGNAGTAPEEFNGFATRYSSLGQNVITGSGSGSDNSSIWLVGWGSQTVFGVYPKGSQAGLQHLDHGEQTIETINGIGGSRIRVYQDQWKWKCGLVVRDWRYVVRIANIDISNLTTESSAANVEKLLIKAYHRLPSLNGAMGAGGLGYNGVRPVIYMNRTVAQMLDIQRYNIATGTNGSTTYGGVAQSTIDGRWTPTFRGIPIRVVDQLLETEATVA